MQQRNRKLHRELNWRRIPAYRRHLYVYAILLLGAVVSNNFKNTILGPANDAQASAAELARLQAMQENTLTLYRFR